ncbi:MAG TPA: ribonuclease P protein component [Stenomitos sp.]
MLPPGARLRRSSEFRAVFESGKAYPDALVVLHVQALPDRPGECQVGFSVSKKVGGAVVRNRVKRRLRAIVAHHLPELIPGHHLVLRARPPAAQAEFGALEAAVCRVLERARLRLCSTVDKGVEAP